MSKVKGGAGSGGGGGAALAARNIAAAKNQVNERRLRPIYDCIDCGNYKKALHEADKVLKKQPDFQTCKVLKGLALVRMGREAEADPILDAVLDEGPTDDATLQAMTFAFRDMMQPEKICQMYANATKKEPSEELLSHLFMSYVRVGNYKKQQEAALALYKARPKNPYYFWAVMSIVLQAGNVDEKLAVNLTLPLAQRMVEKMIKEGKMEQEQETQLYLMVLELQQKYKEGLDVIEGELGQKLDASTSFVNFVNNKRLEYLKKLGKWQEVNALVKKMLRKEPDQWNVYQDYITSVFLIVDQNKEGSGTDAGVAGGGGGVEEAFEFIESQRRENPKCRGPLLAHIELQSRLVARRDPQASEDQICSLLVDHFERFGSKQVCASDLKLFLPSMQPQFVQKFFHATLNAIKLDQRNVPSDIDNVQKHVCWFQMDRLTGGQQQQLLLQHPNTNATTDNSSSSSSSSKSSVDERCKLVEKLCQLFEDCLPMVKDFTPSEISPNDGYAVLAGHILWDLWNETKEDKFFWKAVVFLNYVLNLSPANYNVRFILMKFFNHVGAVGPSLQVHSGLDLKQIQLDSLGYLISRHLQTCGHFEQASHCFTSTLRFFDGNYKDTMDYIMSAYRYGSFDKIREFIKLRERLSNSQHYSSVSVESKLCALMTECSAHSHTVNMITLYEIDPLNEALISTAAPTSNDHHHLELVDNRDFRPMPSWEPAERSLTDDQISESFVQDANFLKFRSMLLRALAVSVYLSEDIAPAAAAASAAATANSSAAVNGHGPALEKGTVLSPILRCLIEDISTHLERVRSPAGEEAAAALTRWPCVQGPDAVTKLSVYLRNDGHNVRLPLVLLKLVVSVLLGRQLDLAELSQLAKDSLKQISEGVSKCVDNSAAAAARGQQAKLIHRDVTFESILYAVEACSFGAILCGVCQRLMTSSTSTSGGGGSSSIVSPPSQQNSQSAQSSSSSSNKQSSSKSSKKKRQQTSSGNTNSNTGAAAAINTVTKETRRDMTQLGPEFNSLVSSIVNCLKEIEVVVDDLKKTVALDSLCSELDLKFSKIRLLEEEGEEKRGKNDDEDEKKNAAAVAQEGRGPGGEKESSAAAAEDQEKTKADLIRKISMDSVQQDIQKRVETSYSLSFHQITSVIKTKSKYLNQLKF